MAIRYQSRGGNTKTVAEAIGKIAGVRAQAIGVPLEEPVDLLYVCLLYTSDAADEL